MQSTSQVPSPLNSLVLENALRALLASHCYGQTVLPGVQNGWQVVRILPSHLAVVEEIDELLIDSPKLMLRNVD